MIADQGWSQGPKHWSRSLEGVAFLLAATAVSALVLVMARARGFGAALLCWFHFFLLGVYAFTFLL